MFIENRYFKVNNRGTKSVWEYNVATGRREIVLAVKSGRGCTRSFGERNKWHLRGSIYRLIWISRTLDAFLPVAFFSSLSSVFSSLSHSPPSSSFSILLFIPLLHEGCLLCPPIVAPTSLHSKTSPDGNRYYAVDFTSCCVSIFSKGLTLARYGARFHWLLVYPVELRSPEIRNVVCGRHIR